MSKFIRSIRIEKEFEGDKVVAVLKPITFADMLAMKGGTDGMIAALRPNIVSLSGIKDADGVDVPLDEVLSTAYFAVLIAEIFGEWLEKCVPGKVLESARSLAGSQADSKSS